MNQLDWKILHKAQVEIINIFSPIYYQISLIETGKITPVALYNWNPLRFSLVLSVLSNKAIKDEKFKSDLLNIKLRYYKRNLILLEKLAEKQDSNRKRLAFKIIRENLDQRHISDYIDITYWYKAYRTSNKTFTKHLVEEIFS